MTAVCIAFVAALATYHLETRVAHRRQREAEDYCLQMRAFEVEEQRLALVERDLFLDEPTLEEELDRITRGRA